MLADDTLLRLETDLGTIEIAVHADRAPTTAAYVRQLVKSGAFEDTSFYRSTTLGVPGRQPLIQGGPLASRILGTDVAHRKITMLESVDATDITGLLHQRGTVSFARDLDGTGRVLPELFICLDDYPELDAGGRSQPDDRGFPAFGTVVDGLDVVSAIAALETDGATSVERLRGEILRHPVRMRQAVS